MYSTSFHYTGKYEVNKLTSLPMCGFIAQLVDHRTGIAEVMGSNPVEALISSFQLLKIGKFTAMITLHIHLHPQYKYELFQIYFTIFNRVVAAFLRRTKEYCSFWNKNFEFSNAVKCNWKEKEKNSVAS